ncbi:MAG: hypothetical protein LBG11_06715, partial [Bifidobacteriaceae bacterium]|nr:hypothetical protein [Bifidobacteriaceae bacterium]
FDLAVADPELIDPYLSNTGEVQLEVVVRTQAGEEVHGSTVAVDLGPNGPEATSNSIDGAGSPNVTLVAEEPVSVAEALAVDETEQPRYYACDWYKNGSLGLRSVQIEHTASTNSNLKVAVVHERSRTATVGYATSSSSATSGFKLAGTQSVTTGTTNNFTTQSGKHSTKYFIQEEYVRLRQGCYGDSTGYKVVWKNKWKAVPSGKTTGGYILTGQATPSASKCGTFNGSAVFSTKLATTFSAGVSLKSAIGIDLSSVAGRTTGQKVTFTSTKSANYKICGTTAYPGNDNTGALVGK